MGATGERSGGGERARQLYADESWLVEYSPRERCLVVTSTDYHAGPLKIDASLWTAFGEAFAPAAGTAGGAAAAAPPAPAPPPAAAGRVQAPPPREGRAAPADLRVVAGGDGWTVAVSRREKRAYFACAPGPAGPFAVSRRDLYRIGKRMGRRGARPRA